MNINVHLKHLMINRNLTSSFLAFASLILTGSYFLISAAITEAQTANPLALKASVACSNSVPTVTLSWTNFNGAKDFSVFRNPSVKGTNVWVAYATVTPTSYTDANVKVGGAYKYQIRAISPQGVERYSDVVTISKLACPTTTPAAATSTTPSTPTTPTTPPVKLTFNPKIATTCATSTPSVTLTWTNPNAAKSYSIWRNPNSAGTKAWGSIAQPATTTYTDMKVSLGATYQYQITATAPDNSTRYSDVLTAGPLACAAGGSSSTSTPPAATTTPPIVPPSPPAATTTATSTTPSTPTTPTTPKTLKWGVYSGWMDGDIKQFETIVGEDPDMMAAFTHWGNANSFPTYMNKYTKDKGRELIIFWEASNYLLTTNDQPAYSYDAIIRGDWDAYIKSFAAAAKSYGGPVILIPFSEMNGNWSPWSGTLNGNTPAKAVAGYRHVRTVFGDVPNVKFGWAPNSNSVPNTAENAIEKYYPGDAYVDYVGVDGFNFDSPWQTFDQVFNKPLTILSQYKKPIYIFSFASSAGTQKAAWITDAITKQMPKYPLLEGWNWFNQNKERNWLIWSDDASLNAFKAATP